MTVATNLKALDDKSVAKGQSYTLSSGVSGTIKANDDTPLATISIQDGVVQANDKGYTTGDTVYNALSDAKTEQEKLIKLNGNQIVIGDGVTADTISVGKSNAERRIVNVAYGEDKHDAAAMGQLIASATNATSNDKAKVQTATLAFKDITLDSLTIEVPGQGTVDANDQRLVSGATLYGETRNAIATTNQTLHYVSEQDAASNLLALDKAIGKTAKGNYISAQDGDIVTVATNLDELDKALKSFDEARNDLVSYNQAGKEILIGSGVNAETISAGSRRITNVTAGTADMDAVNKKQLETAIAATNYTAGNDYVTVDNTAHKISVDVSGSVDPGNTGIVTGGTVYNAVVHNAMYSVSSDKTITVKNGANQTAFTLDLSGLPSGEGGETYWAGKGITISNNDTISAKVGDGLTFSEDGKIVASVGDGLQLADGSIIAKVDNDTIKLKDGKLAANVGASVSEAETGLVTGAQVQAAIDRITPMSGVTAQQVFDTQVNVGQYYATKDKTLAEDIEALDNALHESETKLHWDEAELGDNSDRSIAFGATGTNEKDGVVTTVTGQDSIAIGTASQVTGDKSIAIGYGHTVVGDGSGAFGDPSLIYGNGSYAYGNNNTIGSAGAPVDDAFILGNRAKVTAAGSVAIGSGSEATVGNVVSVGSADNLRRIINVAEAKSDNEAVNYKQLVSYVKDNAGGGSGTGKAYTAGTGISISDADVISVNATGKVAEGDTGVVTGGAIYEKVGDTTKLAEAGLGDNLTDSVLNVNDKIGGLSADINKVGAGAAALAALRPEAFNPEDKWSFAVGYGHYRNANAGALGAFFKPNEDTTLSLGTTVGNGDSMVNAGVSFKLGARGKGVGLYSSNAALVREVNLLRADNEALKADNARMKQQIAFILSKIGMSETVRKSVKG